MADFPIFFESILYINGKFPLLNYHFERIKLLSNQIERDFKYDKNQFENIILNAIIDKSLAYKLRVKLDVKTNIIEIYNIEIFQIEETEICPDKAISLCLFDKPKPKNLYNSFKTVSDLIYKDSILYAESKNFKQSILLNDKHEVIESSFCNIFFLKNDQIFTPPLSSGSVSGVMRKLFLEKYDVIEKTILRSDIPDFDEVFLTNAVKGVIMVNKIENIEFQTNFSNKIRDEIHTNIFWK